MKTVRVLQDKTDGEAKDAEALATIMKAFRDLRRYRSSKVCMFLQATAQTVSRRKQAMRVCIAWAHVEACQNITELKQSQLLMKRLT